MQQQETKFDDSKYQLFLFNCFQNEKEIVENLMCQKHHSKILLVLNIFETSKLLLIGKWLSELNHLRGISITFYYGDDQSEAMKNIFSSLQSMNQLVELTLELRLRRNYNFFSNEYNIADGTVDGISEQVRLETFSCLIKVIRNLKNLKRVKLNLNDVVLQDQNTLLFNSLLNLELLEEIDYSSQLQEDGEQQFVIGEEVCENSKLKILKITVNNYLRNEKSYVFGSNIKKIKSLEVLHFSFFNVLFEDKSIQTLREWTNYWTQLQELHISSRFTLQIKDKTEIIYQLIKTAIQNTKSINKLCLYMFDESPYKAELLSWLPQLENLQTLSCRNFYTSLYASIENKDIERYQNCFKRLPQLRRLELTNIEQVGEIQCFSASMEYLINLQSLTLIFNVLDYQYLEKLYQNFKFLQKLKSLHFQTDGHLIQNEENLTKLFNGLIYLKSIRSLSLLPNHSSTEVFKARIIKIFSELQQLSSLEIPKVDFVQIKQKIIRSCRKLVQKQTIEDDESLPDLDEDEQQQDNVFRDPDCD